MNLSFSSELNRKYGGTRDKGKKTENDVNECGCGGCWNDDGWLNVWQVRSTLKVVAHRGTAIGGFRSRDNGLR